MKRSVNQFKLIAMSLAMVFILTHCSKSDDPTQTPEQNLEMSERLEEVFGIAQLNSINRLTIDWDDLRVEVSAMERRTGYESGLRLLLRSLADNHSFYTFADGRFASESQIRCDGNVYDFSSLPDDIGYIKVNAFSGSTAEALALANSIQQSIREQDVDGLKGWVVDLSNNGGGNMYPMVAGLGPFYRQELLGHFIGPTQQEIEWGYSVDGSFIGDFTRKVTQVEDPYELKNPNLKVAVIVSNNTASSGEATLISFMGRENTLLLGQPSCGLSTANSSFSLSNGDRFTLTVSTMADRERTLFGGQIMPDEQIDSDQDMLERVTEWINQ